MPTVLVIGDSHTRALSLAASSIDSQGVDLEIRWLMVEKDGASRGDLPMDEALRKVKALGEGDLLVLSILGTLHNIYGLLRHEQPFWVCGDGAAETVPPGCEVIPRQAVRALFRHQIHKNKRVRQLLDECCARKAFLMTPPPKGDAGFIESRISKYRDRLVSEAGVTEREVRLRLWQLEAQEVGDYACSKEATLISPPARCLDVDGFLAADYYGPDATHANAEYGRCVLEELVALAKPGRSDGLPAGDF